MERHETVQFAAIVRRDADGNATSDILEGQFDYKLATAISKWIIDVPPAKKP